MRYITILFIAIIAMNTYGLTIELIDESLYITTDNNTLAVIKNTDLGIGCIKGIEVSQGFVLGYYGHITNVSLMTEDFSISRFQVNNESIISYEFGNRGILFENMTPFDAFEISVVIVGCQSSIPYANVSAPDECSSYQSNFTIQKHGDNCSNIDSSQMPLTTSSDSSVVNEECQSSRPYANISTPNECRSYQSNFTRQKQGNSCSNIDSPQMPLITSSDSCDSNMPNSDEIKNYRRMVKKKYKKALTLNEYEFICSSCKKKSQKNHVVIYIIGDVAICCNCYLKELFCNEINITDESGSYQTNSTMQEQGNSCSNIDSSQIPLIASSNSGYLIFHNDEEKAEYRIAIRKKYKRSVTWHEAEFICSRCKYKPKKIHVTRYTSIDTVICCACYKAELFRGEIRK